MKTPSSPNNLIDIFVGVDIGKSFAQIYNHHKHQRNKHHCVAISHVARKLVGIIYVVCARGHLTTPQKYVLSPLDSLQLV